jgi:hypothetical protein
MARRSEIGRLDQPTLRPSASPVDSFTAPRAGTQLADLANSLGELSPALQRLAAAQIEEEKERGRTDATSIYEDIKATGQKIKTGEIAAHESKWYRAAAREQVGRLMAAAYAQDLQLATQSNEELKESTDPQDFDTFEAAARQEWLSKTLEGEDPEFMAGFNATSAQGILNARQSFVAAAADRLDGQVLENTYTEHQITIKNGLQAGFTVEQIAKQISDRNAAFYLANPKLGPGKAGRSLNKTTIEAVFDAARAYEEPELLKILDHIPGGVKGSTIGQTRAALSKRDEVEREIRMNRQNRLAAEEKDEKRARREAVDTVYDQAIAALEADPTVNVSQFAERLMNIDRAEVPKLFSMAKAFATAANVDDLGVASGLYERAFDGDLTFDTVAAAFAQGTITVKTAKDLRAQIKLNRSGRGSKALVQDPVYSAYERDLDGLWLKQMGDVPGARGVYARQQLRREWVSWQQSQEGAAASESQKIDWLQQAVTRNFIRFSDKETETARELVTTSRKPDQPQSAARGPQLPKWETEEVIPWKDWDLEGFAREWQAIKNGKRSKFSGSAESIVTRYDLRGDDIDRFIQAQRLARRLRK